MTTGFEGRERGYENKFAHDKEIEFKIAARVNHLLGLWAAEKMQLEGDKAKEYALSLVAASVGSKPKTIMLEKLQEDFNAVELEVSLDEITAEFNRLKEIVRKESGLDS